MTSSSVPIRNAKNDEVISPHQTAVLANDEIMTFKISVLGHDNVISPRSNAPDHRSGKYANEWRIQKEKLKDLEIGSESIKGNE
jgi:hypothetical protein